MPYQRRGNAAEPTPPPASSDEVGDDASPGPVPQVSRARKSLWIVGLAIGAYMIISGIVQAILAAQH